MRFRFESDGTVYEVILERQESGYRVVVDGEPFDLEILDSQPGKLNLLFGERPATMYWADDGDLKWISTQGCSYRLRKPSPRRSRPPGGTGDGESLRAPMPAQVRVVQVFSGDLVEAGQTLMLLEAMKMEIRLQAPRRGRVSRILAQAGQTVERDQVLIEMGDEK